MKSGPHGNLVASVTARLRERSRGLGENHQYVLLRYAVERLMFRLSQSAMRSGSSSRAR